MNKLFSAFLLSAILLFSACQKDNSNNNNNSSSITVEKDGVAINATTSNNTLAFLQEYGEAGRRLDIRANLGSGEMLIISVSNWDMQNPPNDGIITKTYNTNLTENNQMGAGPNQSCTSIGPVNFCDGALGTYMTSAYVPYVSENVTNAPIGEITITQNNTTDKTVSGTFNFKVSDVQNLQTINFEGSFSNLSYMVLQ